MLRYSQAVGQYENNGTPIQALAVKDGGHYWNMAGGQEYLRTRPSLRLCSFMIYLGNEAMIRKQ